jgi:hypothetical protein
MGFTRPLPRSVTVVRGTMMATRHHISAMDRTADAAAAGAALTLVLGGLLLLSAP